MAEEKKVVYDKEYGSGTDFTVTRGKYEMDGVIHYKFAWHLNFPSDLTPEIDRLYRNIGIKGILDNRFAGVFRESNNFGTEEEAQAFLERFSSPQGFIDAVTKKERAPRAAAERLDDAESLAIKYLTKAILQKAGLDKPTADDRKAAKGKAKELRAAGHKAYVALKKLADAEVAKRDKALEAADLLD